jgi:hypothetical protein
MNVERNVGGFDRLGRAVVGTTLAVAAIGALLSDHHRGALLAAIASAGLLFNATTGFCGCNAALGIDTTSEK